MTNEIVGKYQSSSNIRDNALLRESFNDLTRATFGFDFKEWYAKGHWQDKYIPHVLIDDGKVISNASVNLMKFLVNGQEKHLIQIGTVMTDEKYRRRGLNRRIIEQIFEEYRGKADGIYLFANDNAKAYYEKLGFQSAKEYEYRCKKVSRAVDRQNSYAIEHIDLSLQENCDKLYTAMKEANGNDAFFMSDNLGLYQFWLAAEFGESVYFVPQTGNYVIADIEGSTLAVHQIFGRNPLDIHKLAVSFETEISGQEIIDIKLGFTPVEKELFEIKEYQEEDCTLFIMGKELEEIMQSRILFPVMSHA